MMRKVSQRVQNTSKNVFKIRPKTARNIEPGAKQSAERVFAISLVTRRRTATVTATEMSRSPATHIYNIQLRH